MKRVLIFMTALLLIVGVSALVTAYFTDLDQELLGQNICFTLAEQLSERGPLLVPVDVQVAVANREPISLGVRTFEFGDIGWLSQDGSFEFLGTGEVFGSQQLYVVRYRRPDCGDKWLNRLERVETDNLNARNFLPDGTIIFRTKEQMEQAYDYTRQRETRQALVAQLVP